MRTNSYLYHVQRRDALAFGDEPDMSHWDVFSAEAEDAAALHDAFTVYDEQAVRDYYRMFSILHSTAGRAVATRVEDVEELIESIR